MWQATNCSPRPRWAAPTRWPSRRGVPGLALMENAGRAVAEAAAELAGRAGAADRGRLRARQQRRRRLRRGAAAARAGLSGCALGLLGSRDGSEGRCGRDGRRAGASAIEPLSPATIAGADLIVDALFGAGLSRPLEGVAAEVVAAINAAGKPIVAVDVPSGLDGTTGASTRAGRAGDAHRHLLPPEARAPAAAGAHAVRRGAARRHRHPRRRARRDRPAHVRQPPLAVARRSIPGRASMAHKYTRGHAVVVSGPAESTGAARLGARGALRIGAGLVTVVGSATATAVNATH